MKSRLIVLIGVTLLALGVIAASMTLNAGDVPKKIRVIYTNDTSGYLESCGCGGVRDGGLARRVTVVNKLTQENPNTVIVESGNLSNAPDRIGIIMSVLSELKYDAVGVGEMDVRTGTDLFYTEAAKHKIRIIDPRAGAPESTLPFFVKEVDGVKIGIVSFGVGPFDPNANEYESRKSMYNAFKSARESSDVLIVLDQANIVTAQWLERNGKRLGVPDIVVSGTSKSGMSEAQVIGTTYIVPTSTQGKHLGFVDIEVTPGSQPKMVCTRVHLGDDVVEDSKTKARVDAFVGRGTVIVGESSVESVPVATAPKPSEKEIYYSPELCRTCHIKEYEDWAKTAHAKAIKTLVDVQRLVPECLPCHSEEYRKLSSVAIPEDGIGGVECATCHMDALPHDMERKGVEQKTRVSAQSCLTCHTPGRSPKYDEQVYFPRVSHLGAKSATSSSTSAAQHP